MTTPQGQPPAQMPKPVLEYFNPSQSTALGQETEFQLVPPPTWGSMVGISVVFSVLAGMMLVGLVLAVKAIVDGEPWLSTLGLLAIFLAVIVPFAWLLLRALVRIARHGREPIRVAVAGDELVVLAPQQWGTTPRHWRREEIDYLDVTHWGVSLFGPQRYELRIILATLSTEAVIFLAPDPALPRKMELRLREAMRIEHGGPWG